MRFETKNFTSIIRGKRAASLPDQSVFINPSRDWMFVLSAAVLCFIAGVAYTAHDFRSQFSPTAATSNESSGVSYPASDVIRYAEIYNERESAFTELRDEAHAEPGAFRESESSLREGTETQTPLAEEWIAQ